MDKWTLRALTKIWTGDVGQKSDRLIPPGIMGSLRWWYEVLVRGLGGKACDPTSDVRCPDQNGRHCVACELFGCTGWARKFRLMVLDDRDQVVQNQIQADQTFILRFIPLRPIAPEEWCLLDATLLLIADYGAMGGKTVFKPSEEPNKQNAPHHQDLGLVQYVQGPDGWQCDKKLEDIRAYVTNSHWREVPHSYQDNQRKTHDFSWASLQNFWCVKGQYLARQEVDESAFNRVVGRNPSKKCSQCGTVHPLDRRCPKTKKKYEKRFSDINPDPKESCTDAWLAGRQQESKKVFSFKHPQNARRTFGFVKPGLVDFDEMKRRLRQVWPNFQDSEFKTGVQILDKLFR